MFGSAKLSAEKVIAAYFCCLEPFTRITARHYIHFGAKRGQIKTVNDILRCQDESHDAANWNMEFIDLPIPFRVLHFPHPLLADDVDLHSSGRRTLLLEVHMSSPGKHSHHEQQWDDNPCNLNRGLRKARRTPVYFPSTAILNKEKGKSQKNEHYHQCAEAGQREIELIDWLRYGRGLI